MWVWVWVPTKPSRSRHARRTLRELHRAVCFLHVAHGYEPGALQFLWSRRGGGTEVGTEVSSRGSSFRGLFLVVSNQSRQARTDRTPGFRGTEVSCRESWYHRRSSRWFAIAHRGWRGDDDSASRAHWL